MSTTDIVINLSDGLKGLNGAEDSHYRLNQAGVYAYAVYFETKITTPNAADPVTEYKMYTTTLVDNGVVQNGGATTVSLPVNGSTGNTQFISGKLYIIIQSGQPNGDLFTGTNKITQESDINWGNAQSNNYRFDSIELNVDNSAYDVANLTSVNGFGLPMTIGNGLGDTRGYNLAAGTAGDDTTLFGKIAQASSSPGTTQDILYAASTGSWVDQNSPLHGNQRMMLSPTEAVGQNVAAFTNSQWMQYVTSLQSNAVANDIVVSGWYNGSPDGNGIWHNAGFFSYQLSWDGADFWLKPTSTSAIKGDIRIDPSDLANSIYATNGNAEIFNGGTQFYTNPANTGAMNTGDNSQWGNVFVSVLTGFTAGYYGATANSVNPLLSSVTIDLNKTWNWDPTYAFGNPAVESGAGHVTASPHVFYDKYSQAFFGYTNSYGGGYSDALMKAFPAGGPLMTLWNGTADVSSLVVNLFADDETPTPSDYVTPTMYNYLEPNGGGYATLDNFFVGDGNNFTIALGTGTVMVKDDTPISLGFYDSTLNGGNGGFRTVSLPAGQSIYQSWTIVDDGSGNPVLASETPNSPTNNTSVVFTGMPVMQDDALAEGKDIAWYQLTVGAKVFNVYVQIDPTTHAFVWTPNAQAMSPTARMDGLGFITGETTDGPHNDLTLNVAGASGIAVDSSLWTQITSQTIMNASSAFVTPWAPVIGTVDSDNAFTYLTGFTPMANTKANFNPGWVMPSAPTTTQGDLAFGWNGADTAYLLAHLTPDTSEVYGYTNKIGALNAAVLSFTGTGSTVGNWVPVVAVADLDGQWQTGGVQFGNGTFQVTMTEYQPGDLGTALAKTSQFQAFTVAMDDLLLTTADGGAALALDNTGHASTPGNWIRLSTASSTLPNGTLVAYATNDSGQMVDRAGSVTASLHEATLVRIGLVKSDVGDTMFSGDQSVYLPVGQQMHFAIVTGNGTVDSSPTVDITGSGGSDSYTVGVSNGSGMLSMTAQVIAGNTLTTDAVTAAAQRNDDTAWIYLTHGATVDVDLAWSSGYVNTLHFVKIDIDATTGAWSVGGVAYGNTEDFRTAVRDNWDSGFSASHGNGTGSDTSATWTVAGTSGYYAPVLVNGANELFIIDHGTTIANQDNATHIRMYGENIFGFEDKIGGDWDYNDMVLKLAITG
ncbi:MAG: hypothetical protein KIT25_09805 [Enhydrobacter sp.]|nr:MAG: hypothetical protein KIT25_09805 [Enhydrobacter sp.]